MNSPPDPLPSPARAALDYASAADFPRGRPVGGWLILPVIGLFISPVRIAFALGNTFVPLWANGAWAKLTTPGSPQYHRLWGPLLLFELGGNLAQAGLDVALLIMLFRKSRLFPRMMVLLLVMSLAYSATVRLLSGQILTLTGAGANDFEAWVPLARAAISAGIWIPYFLLSRRVKETFVV